MNAQSNDNSSTDVTKYNATKHGILRDTITSFESADYGVFYDEMEAYYRPQNPIEKILLERIVLSKVKLDRITKAESEIIKEGIDPKITKDPSAPWESVVSKGYSPTIKYDSIAKLDLYSRYETQAENRMYKAIHMLNVMRNQ
jgi:hypothetical protein